MSDIEADMELYKRTVGDMTYYVVKLGMLVEGVIMPALLNADNHQSDLELMTRAIRRAVEKRKADEELQQ